MSITKLITFGNQKYTNSVARLVREAKGTGMFDSVVGYRESDLQNDVDFWSKHGRFIESNKRGYGYWMWKPYLILKTLAELDDDDILVYVDAGCSIQSSGNARLKEYFDIVRASNYGLLAFNMGHLPERHWNKIDTVLRVGATQEHLDMGQMVGGIVIMRKCEHVMKIYREEFEIICEDNYHYIDDSPCRVPNDPTFRDHRHDQSIFSLLCKKYGCECLPDETYSDGVWDPLKPIWAKRLV